MNVQELRIGNWVSAQGRNCLCYGQIKSVNVDGCVIDFSATLTEKEWLEAGMIPIPLTEEVLLKCGFVYKRTDKSDTYRLGDFRVNYVTEGRFKDRRYLIYGSVLSFEDFVHCAYLHQLQNLYFALTGTELEYTP